MEPSTTGSLRIFRAAGIDVYLHWTWFVVALLFGMPREHDDLAPMWKLALYVTLFGIVLMHEFGHALACRQVGGEAHRIVLWPLGGIAYVAPPARPGALLWSIAAGPLVNFVLLVPTLSLVGWAMLGGWPADVTLFLGHVAVVNAGLLVFNLLPIYPLDGGQILHALLWYGVGRWHSLLAVSVVGGVLGVLVCMGSILLALVNPAVLMLALIAAFVVLRSWSAFQVARHMLHLEQLPRHRDCACPNCHEGPPRGPYWECEHCSTRFDTFQTRGKCPACGAWYLDTTCPYCRAEHHVDRWFAGRPDEEVLDAIPVPGPAEHPTPS
jgi:Zn-dependent protease